MAEYFIRISSLNKWNQCEGQAVTDLDQDLLEGEAGPAAHTGTAVGRAIELFHRAILGSTAPDLKGIIKLTKEESAKAERPFEKAKWRDVEAVFEEYSKDPRNVEHIVLPEVPLRHEFMLGADRIILAGTVDQIRLTDHGAEIWDLKNGAGDGDEMRFNYFPQLYGYTYALHRGGLPYHVDYPRSAYTKEAKLGGVIRLQDYVKPLPRAGQKVFYPISHSIRSIEKGLERLVTRIVELQKGSKPNLKPGHHCSWCKLKAYEACVFLV